MVEAAKSDNPSTWRPFEAALDILCNGNGFYDGVQFALGDGWCGIDLDDVLVDGSLIPWNDEFLGSCAHPNLMLPPAEIIRQIGSYSEISPSGNGIKIFGRGITPAHRKKHVRGGQAIEIYSEGRFFCCTGNGSGQLEDIWEKAVTLHRLVFGDAPRVSRRKLDGITVYNPVIPETKIPNSQDKYVWLKIFSSGWKGEAQRLFSGIVEPGRQSEADFKLAYMLSTYTRDPGQIARMMHSTKLVREKWQKHKTYLGWTIAKALERRALSELARKDRTK